MDKSHAVECVKKFAERVRGMMDVQQVILFGSYAHGTPHEYSDIDVAVVASYPASEWHKTATALFRLRRDIDLSIEPILLDPAHDRSGFLEEIRRTGEIIYSRDA